MEPRPRKLVVIPAYNEERYLPKVLDALRPLKKRGDYEVLVIDDGSQDKTAHIARHMGFKVISHHDNLGKTQALKTGLEYAIEGGFKHMAVFDADWFNPSVKHVKKMFKPLEKRGKDGLPKTLRTIGRTDEAGWKRDDRNWLINYSGVMGFNVATLKPWLAGNEKWNDYMDDTRWPEHPLAVLMSDQKTQLVDGIVFEKASPLRRAEEGYARFHQDREAVLDQIHAMQVKEKRDAIARGQEMEKLSPTELEAAVNIRMA
ncbi:glycosyltransferase family 2 protein, partial [Candidatus Altiarchaeota archaeon]